MDIVLPYIKAFVVGGILCVIGQLLIDKTKLTPARILTAYVVAGVVLGAVGIYQPLADFAGAGATVPLTGFGNLLARGVKKAAPHPRRNGCGAFHFAESGQRVRSQSVMEASPRFCQSAYGMAWNSVSVRSGRAAL